jgi:predicted DNA-binding protein (UPF0251 family)
MASFRPPLCCVCGLYRPNISTGWLCAGCYARHPELQRPFREWPQWAKALKNAEQNRRRDAVRAYKNAEPLKGARLPSWLLELNSDPAHASWRDRQRQVVRAGIARLGLEDQVVLRMRFFEDATEQAIANALAVSQPTAHRMIGRALIRLGKQLGATDAALEGVSEDYGLTNFQNILVERE